DYPRGGALASATYRHVYGSYIDEPLLRETVTGSVRHFFHRNQQYSVTALSDSAGDTAERYAYTAYGALSIFNPAGTPQATTTLHNRYTYTGREHDPDLNLYHFRARLYDPTAGRFLGRDPLGFVDGMSLYRGYFESAKLDPFGLSPAIRSSMNWAIKRMSDGQCYQNQHGIPECVTAGGEIRKKCRVKVECMNMIWGVGPRHCGIHVINGCDPRDALPQRRITAFPIV
ncbi:MAG: RHS repeat-associated core domain-containing protein, partial [Pirellula sp.]|nr:RHS repeat-associated core domain-containing protein [Pirellula sp.]